jgi:MerR family transcriptional regulator, light-induced transcriptional regulator
VSARGLGKAPSGDRPEAAVAERGSQASGHRSIAAVERETGLSKDTLRVWERRYGFPTPLRDAAGERAYPTEQVDKLRVLKRLLDGGHRPGRVVPLPLGELLSLSASTQGSTTDADTFAPQGVDVRACMAELARHDVDGLRRQLAQAQARLGLGRFVLEVVAPLNTLVGESWMRGQLEIFQEHTYTESVQVVMRQAMATLANHVAPGDGPRVLLGTLPGEPHGLGLLMAEAMLAVNGARCISLGVQTPVWDLVLATRAYQCDIVALSFTGCMLPAQVTAALTELRAKLPTEVALWVGGAAPVLHRRPVQGVRAIASLAALHDELQGWRGQPAAMLLQGSRLSSTQG